MMVLFPSFNKQLARIVCVCVSVCAGGMKEKLFLASHLASRQHIQHSTRHIYEGESTLQFIFPIIIIKLHFLLTHTQTRCCEGNCKFILLQPDDDDDDNNDDDGRNTANEGCL